MINACWVGYLIFIHVIFVGHFPQNVWCQKGAPSRKPIPRITPIVSNLFLAKFNHTVEKFQPAIEKEIGFCTEDVKKDFHGAFNFQGRDRFFQKCHEKLQDLPIRMCTVSELKVYFISFLKNGGDKKSVSESHFLEPNRNCNLTSWSAGCEAGWASAANPGQKYDYNETNPQKMPFRTSNSKPCCEGFFCPEGLTCMIPCPLGAHCPVATLIPATGICSPYHYQLPSGKLNHTCGAADMWVPVHLGNELFCDPGYYCPTTIKKIECPRGYYCRMGSRVKYRCFAGTKCDKGTEIPSMQVFGLLLIALLTAVLIVVYNCSDQVISTRSEKQAKSREAAAKYARESAQARQKSRASRDAWKPSGLQGLQETLSRTFTRTKTKNASGPHVNKKDTNSVDDNLEDKSSNLESGDKNMNAKHTRKTSKELHTRSQIFKYAYGQIEREKAMDGMNMDMRYDGEGISLRQRPRIEVAFKELTLTLKGKRKNIMRCVSGKILPGRISAVMGPSGAGKTTFLSALTGKITGCNMSGMILINGKNESIHSYKKIVGFVPQDDIVHGDLTVEENLRFSARCRLSADIPKADKVLITERVIEALGLQGVRDSRVGTVEKRGISGGQKKRVNVGLEMVMEPSLLILDEPTSGLDSASSSLLLRALRREALEGVNISMVVHQPSYSLYKMFDDLILLAKGGITVYHGPVEKVEEYFGGMGIMIPDRVNTPDHLIDILEGITKPGGNVTAQQLPVKWMLHNGYRVPPDMLHLCDQDGSSSSSSSSSSHAELVEQADSQREVEKYNYFTTPDLSGRVTPGVFRQYRYYLGRVAKQRLRDARVQAADYIILLLAGACLGTMAEVSDVSFGYTGYQYTVIAVSLLCMIGGLRTFSQDKLQYRRESASGMNSLSYFLAKDTMDLLNVVMKPLVYLCMFYFLSYPRSSFASNYLILLCLVYCVTGISYTLAISLEFSQAQLWSVLLPVVLTLIANQDKTSAISLVSRFVFPRWALEAFVTANAKEYTGVWLMTRCAALKKFDYDIHNSKKCLYYLMATGMGCRILAFICLMSRSK